jgi:hypothetical protein
MPAEPDVSESPGRRRQVGRKTRRAAGLAAPYRNRAGFEPFRGVFSPNDVCAYKTLGLGQSQTDATPTAAAQNRRG